MGSHEHLDSTKTMVMTKPRVCRGSRREVVFSCRAHWNHLESFKATLQPGSYPRSVKSESLGGGARASMLVQSFLVLPSIAGVKSS